MRLGQVRSFEAFEETAGEFVERNAGADFDRGSLTPNDVMTVQQDRARQITAPIPGLGSIQALMLSNARSRSIVPMAFSRRPASLVVTDPRTIRAVDPTKKMIQSNGLGYGITRDEAGQDASLRFNETQLYYRKYGTDVIEKPPVRRARNQIVNFPADVREMRREGTSLRGGSLGQEKKVEDLSNEELLDIVRLSSLQAILWISMDRATSFLAGFTADSNRLSAMARAVGTPEATDAARKIGQALLQARTQLPKFKEKSRDLFEATDAVAKILEGRGVGVRWAAISVNPQNPEGSITRAERIAPNPLQPTVDLFDSLLVKTFGENSAEFDAARARVKESAIRLGVPADQLGIGPAVIILILGVALILGLTVVGIHAVNKAAEAFVVLFQSFPEVRAAFSEFLRQLGEAAKEGAKGFGQTVPIVAGVAVLIALIAVLA